MIIKKLSTGLFILITLNGCVQSTAFLGPAVTGASTGNIYQAGLSYTSNSLLEKQLGKNPSAFFPLLNSVAFCTKVNLLHLSYSCALSLIKLTIL